MKKGTGAALSGRALALVGGAVALAAAIAGAPASLAPELARRSGAEFSFERAEGTLWKGELKGVRAKGMALGDIAFTTRPFDLAAGRVTAELSARGGALAGMARASLAANGRFALEDARLRFDLAAADRYLILGEPMSGAVRADVDQLVIGPQGCQRAEARLWSDVLSGPARRYDAADLEIEGRSACEGRNLVVSLAGQSADGGVTMTLRITPDLTYTLVAEASPTREDVADALTFLGFERSEDAMTIATSGVIRSVGS